MDAPDGPGPKQYQISMLSILEKSEKSKKFDIDSWYNPYALASTFCVYSIFLT